MLESNSLFCIFCFDFLWAYHLFLRGLLCLLLSTSVIIRISFLIPVFLKLRVGTFFILVITFLTIVTCTIGWHLYPVIYLAEDVFWDALHHLFTLEHVVVPISKAHSKFCLSFGC